MLVNEFLEHSVALFPNKTALIFENTRYTFTDIEQAANNMAFSLLANGFGKHDRVVIYLDNSFETVVSIFGVLKAGGVFVLVNPTVKPKKMDFIVSDCLPTVLVTDSNHAIDLSVGSPVLTRIPITVMTDYDKLRLCDEITFGKRLFAFQGFTENTHSRHLEGTCIDVDLASLIYTSGSSGNPKGVMLTHLNIVSAANSITHYLENTENDIIIDTLPLSFDYGLYQILMAFKIGGTAVLERGFIFPEHVINLVVKERVTGWPIVPTIAAILCRLKNLEKHDFSCLRYITSTGQVLPTPHLMNLKKSFPGAKLYSMYGLTECKRVSYLPPQDIDKKPTSVGKAMPNLEAYLVDTDGKEITQSEKPGELVVRGASVMRGYWNLPGETEVALRPGFNQGEKVLFTGDIFKKDEDGYLYFIGRKDDIIKTSGHMVSPKEVENVLYEIGDVVEAAVIGVKDEILGQAVKAFICLDANSKIKEKDILNYCNKNLESYAVPKYIVLVDALPKTGSGKIQKIDLS